MGYLDAAESAVHDLARRQHGIITRAQARGLGVGADAMRLRITRGTFVPYRNVLRLEGWPDDDRARAWTAVLRGGPDTVLTGTSALQVLGADCPAPVPAVVLPPDRHQVVPEAEVLRETVHASEVTVVDGLPVRRRPLAVIDALRTLPAGVAADLADRALLLRWCRPDHLDHWLSGNVGRRGARQLRQVRRQVGDGAASHAERVAHRLLHRGGIEGWQANLRVHDARGLIGIIDIGFERHRIAVEIDGRAHHQSPERFQRDRARQNRLALAGWLVLRFTWDDLVRRPDHVLRTLRDALRDRTAVAG